MVVLMKAETKMILRWINANAHKSDLWIDCHTDSSGIADDATAYLHAVICSDSATTSLITLAQSEITKAYIAKGYFVSGAEKTGIGAWTEQGNNYPKTLYARHICGIPSIMIEQYVGNPYYGGTKTIANTEADINNYVTMLRAYVLAVLKREAITITGDDFSWYIYQSMMENHFIADDTSLDEPETPDEPDEPEEPVIPTNTVFTHGGINGNGTFSTATYRAHSDFIECASNSAITVTNMSNYDIVDIGVYEADKTTFRELTTNQEVTYARSGNNLVLTASDGFSEVYPTGKYIVFSVKRIDEPYGTIDLADFANTTIVVGEVTPDEPDSGDSSFAFEHGGINGADGTFNTWNTRAHSDLIEVPESGVFTVTNMDGYSLIDVGVYEADGTTFKELTTYYTKTDSGNDWVFKMGTETGNFNALYPTGKYVRFSVKLADGSNGIVDLAALANSQLVY